MPATMKTELLRSHVHQPSLALPSLALPCLAFPFLSFFIYLFVTVSLYVALDVLELAMYVGQARLKPRDPNCNLFWTLSVHCPQQSSVA